MRVRFAPASIILCFLPLLGCKPYRPTPTSDEFRNTFATMGEVQIVKMLSEKQAPAEFNCPPQDMTFKSTGASGRVIVSGCGKKATYHFVDSVGWVLNTDIQPDDASTPTTADVAPSDTTESEATP